MLILVGKVWIPFSRKGSRLVKHFKVFYADDGGYGPYDKRIRGPIGVLGMFDDDGMYMCTY